jgi:hypothetical protein
LFLYGRSFGGLIAHYLAVSQIGSKMFRACALMTPFYRLPNPKSYKFLTPCKILNWIHPFLTLPNTRSYPEPEYIEKWKHVIEFPQNPVVGRPRIICIWEVMQWEVKEKTKNSKMPFSVCVSSDDKTVSNIAIFEWMKGSTHP